MKWENKAKIMQICSSIPKGDYLYKLIQNKFGRLNHNPLSRINMQIEMTRLLHKQGMPIKGYTFFEVGTGHKPIVPIGFFLAGAARIITVDLNRRLDFNNLKKSLAWMVENRNQLEPIYHEFTDSNSLNQRLNLLQKLQSQPQKFMEEANIQYLAPSDAAATNLPNDSVDYHLSTTVMEHIPLDVIKNVFLEARRILKPGGAAIHFIDLSDHFQHQDKSINKINFLRYSEEQWLRIAGNQFAYCNRLRASEFLQIFSELSFKILWSEVEVDNVSVTSLKNGFTIDNKFSAYDINDICTTGLKLVLSK
jgi:SAM-dependent methyltransferase